MGFACGSKQFECIIRVAYEPGREFAMREETLRACQSTNSELIALATPHLRPTNLAGCIFMRTFAVCWIIIVMCAPGFASHVPGLVCAKSKVTCHWH